MLIWKKVINKLNNNDMEKENNNPCHDCYYYQPLTDKVFQCNAGGAGIWYSESKRTTCKFYKKKRQ